MEEAEQACNRCCKTPAQGVTFSAKSGTEGDFSTCDGCRESQNANKRQHTRERNALATTVGMPRREAKETACGPQRPIFRRFYRGFAKWAQKNPREFNDASKRSAWRERAVDALHKLHYECVSERSLKEAFVQFAQEERNKKRAQQQSPA